LARGKSETGGWEADQAARSLENGRKTEIFSARVQELDTGRTSAGTKPDTRGSKIWTKKTAAGGALKIEENTVREPKFQVQKPSRTKGEQPGTNSAAVKPRPKTNMNLRLGSAT
jgi:hypothetical protein